MKIKLLSIFLFSFLMFSCTKYKGTIIVEPKTIDVAPLDPNSSVLDFKTDGEIRKAVTVYSNVRLIDDESKKTICQLVDGTNFIELPKGEYLIVGTLKTTDNYGNLFTNMSGERQKSFYVDENFSISTAEDAISWPRDWQSVDKNFD